MNRCLHLFAGISLAAVLLYGCSGGSSKTPAAETYHEPFRPQFHFSPAAHWMNDPNGLVYANGVYHLFFQYYPDSTVWGPMHWGHATSTDLVHWEEQRIALYPDSLGYIFSGCAVIDSANTAGFGNSPLVAIFTQHSPQGEKAGRIDFQNQSLAYSFDNGDTWTKYSGNPVIKNPGIADFRDPNVSWYAPGQKWMLTLAVKDHVSFYSSPDLKNWTKESDFGVDRGAHGGVWECPDLFPINDSGTTRWVLTVSINPGAPNGGSGTQYFIGDFDGHRFTTTQEATQWIDQGTDNYAGVTWHHTGTRSIFLGWMSNWDYAQAVPTSTWRSAMTMPRDITLVKVNERACLKLQPVPELNTLKENTQEFSAVDLSTQSDLSGNIKSFQHRFVLSLTGDTLRDFTLKLSNAAGEELRIGYTAATNQYFIDRTRAGAVSFSSKFPKKIVATRVAGAQGLDLQIWMDEASVELFADGGLTNMTSIFFPAQPFTRLQCEAPAPLTARKITWSGLKSIWP